MGYRGRGGGPRPTQVKIQSRGSVPRCLAAMVKSESSFLGTFTKSSSHAPRSSSSLRLSCCLQCTTLAGTWPKPLAWGRGIWKQEDVHGSRGSHKLRFSVFGYRDPWMKQRSILVGRGSLSCEDPSKLKILPLIPNHWPSINVTSTSVFMREPGGGVISSERERKKGNTGDGT